MGLFYQQDINESTKMAVWHIIEEEDFFQCKAPLNREIIHPHKRIQHKTGRYLLQYLYPDFPYEEMLIADSRKPYLPNERYHFSISHSGDYAAAIVSSKSRVGIDVEGIRPLVLKVQHKFLHPEELDFVSNYKEDIRLQLLTVIWSAKEAIYKWWSYGNIDFSDNMRVLPFNFSIDGGTIDAFLLYEGEAHSLLLRYTIMNGVSIVWVHPNK